MHPESQSQCAPRPTITVVIKGGCSCHFQRELTRFLRFDVGSGEWRVRDEGFDHAVPQVLTGTDVVEVFDGKPMQTFLVPMRVKGGIAAKFVLLPGGENEGAGQSFQQARQRALL